MTKAMKAKQKNSGNETCVKTLGDMYCLAILIFEKTSPFQKVTSF